MDEEDSLFAITLDSDSDTEQKVKEHQEKVPRDFQSEDSFKGVLRSWRPRVEVGDLYKNLILPINNPSKPQSQEILHAIEELYFLKRYQEALVLVKKALEGELTGEFSGVLERYGGRCEKRIERSSGK